MNVHVSFQIQGVAPLLQNNPEGKELKPANPTRQYGEKPDDEWRRSVYTTSDGKLGHPSEGLKASILTAASTFEGKKKSQTMKFPLKHALFMDNQYLTFENREQPDGPYLDRPRDRTGQMLKRIVPMFDTGWILSGQFRFDDEVVTLDRLKAIIDRAGERFGIGCHRPEFGRFIVISFDTVNGNGKKKH